MAEKLQWGILGTGQIAGTFADGLAASATGALVAVGSRSEASAERFGVKYAVARRHGSYEALLADPGVQAVYIATPHPQHREWATKAAAAGKHILCEKPMGVNEGEVQAIIDTARRHDVFLMEAFMYRGHPQITLLLDLISQGAIGQVRVIQATFSFHAPPEMGPTSRLLANELAGGGILDVGCYPASFCRLVAGAAIGRPFAEPIELCGAARLGETGVDEWAIASARFPGGVLAQLSAGVLCAQENVARVYGSKGWIHIPQPWSPSCFGEPSKIVVHEDGKPEREIVIEPAAGLYTMEADLVAASIARRQAPSPAMTWGRFAGQHPPARPLARRHRAALRLRARLTSAAPIIELRACSAATTNPSRPAWKGGTAGGPTAGPTAVPNPAIIDFTAFCCASPNAIRAASGVA